MQDKLFEEEKVKKSFYTNGKVSIKLGPDETPPEGFWKGRTFNVNTWNKGKTAEEDPRIASNVANMTKTRKENGSYENPWNKNKTKETDPRLQVVSDKVSAAMQGNEPWNKGQPLSSNHKANLSKSMKGTVPYNKGLTKDTHDALRRASEKLKGHSCFVTDWEAAKKKEYETKKRNHSFNSSKPEQELISTLIAEYGIDDVIHPYRDGRYPFNCDVYIKSQDLFIEFNGTIEHNGRPFDSTNPEHVAEAVHIEDRARELGPNSRYWNILKWWTEIDPKKLETFRKNNLNFRIIYPNNLIIEK